MDLAVEMPPEMFQSRDHLNFQYLDKRAAYVGELGRRLSTCQGPLAGMKVHYVALQGDVFWPSLVLRHGDAWEVRLERLKGDSQFSLQSRYAVYT